MTDLYVLPAKLPAIHTQQGPVTLERIHVNHAEMLAKAGADSADHVHQWLGKELCPISLRAAVKVIADLEEKRIQGFGICYLLIFNQQCLGLGIINYIHPTHKNANLGYWLHPASVGQGLASALCKSLTRLAFTQMDLMRLELLIEPANYASIALAERIGASKEGLCKKRLWGTRDAYLYSIVA
ncbi:GNAT family N-acetyltransferase [Alteromonas sp. 5E99-2]|uniref:GNAT family N-acetyltransferase n=1 Tax=Alteromonas sp. 5E99-2 TaxID=2817683 RepID=UPI001A99F448|nr:GNAT family N-acetyltransferase [Alteromonas sp. 5E99-2]